MSVLASDVLTDASRELNDSSNTRWQAGTLYHYLTDGLNALNQIRPDAFLDDDGTTKNTPPTVTSGSTNCLVSFEFRSALVGYVAARCLTEDTADEKNADRAKLLYGRFDVLNPKSAAR